MRPPEFTDQPPFDWSWTIAENDYDEGTLGDTYAFADDSSGTPSAYGVAAAALAALPLPSLERQGGGTPRMLAAVSQCDYLGPSIFQCSAFALNYGIAWYSATCSFSIQWDEVVEFSSRAAGATDFVIDTGATITTARTYTGDNVSIGGLCVPADFFTSDNWNASDVLATFASPSPGTPDITTPSKRVTLSLQNIRFSVVAGYTAPTDGSANAFPA